MLKQYLMGFAMLLVTTVVNGQSDYTADQRYAAHSVLATGHWAKIRVPQTGFYLLTDAMIHRAGFSDPSQVKVYGYGGALQPERITADYLAATDDLSEIPTAAVAGGRVFFGVGTVNWDSSTALLRSRNPYSDYGYYFLTDGSGNTVEADELLRLYYPQPADYNALYEVDNFAWYHGGRNLYDGRLLGQDGPYTYTLPAYSKDGTLTVVMSYDGYCEATVSVNDSLVGSILVSSKTASKSNKRLKALPDDYSEAIADSWSFNVHDILTPQTTITITQVSGGKMRLDYVSLNSSQPREAPVLSAGALPEPEFVGVVQNQDLHADPQADMVIIIPASGQMEEQAQRLRQLHETYDQMRVNVVRADQLFNEFSSGTPDANAYRRYLKMLYDRATSPADKPRYLLLFGDGAWDNRMLSSDWKTTSPDDFLLCFESENSFSETNCYVSDDFFCLLDDNEGADMLTDIIDISVGRLPARNADQARIMVDKAIAYRTNQYAGDWQNVLCFMGDDGDKNRHMEDAEKVLDAISDRTGAFRINKIYWDAYKMTTTTTGNRYPEVERMIKQQMQDGALVMNYTGHGSANSFSHELVVLLNDFKTATSMRMPLWVTASCDIMPFDTQIENIGETAMLNSMGGAIAFYGTTRTVYAAYNRPMNQSFMTHVLGYTNGVRNTIGDAARMAKNEFTTGTSRDMIINKQQFTLLGDPALVLAMPTLSAVVDRINGQPVTGVLQRLAPGTVATVEGHVEGMPFNGIATLTICDAEVTVDGRCNNLSVTPTPITFTSRGEVIYTASTPVTDGNFVFSFTVPLDISYSEAPVQMLVYAVSDDKVNTAHGECLHASMGDAVQGDDREGPVISCTLDNLEPADGIIVNAMPFFYAELSDPSGINLSEVSFGHGLQITIDGSQRRTYLLNSLFMSLDDPTQGTVAYTLPWMEDGLHHFKFQAWDPYNNVSTVEFDFFVNQGAGIGDVRSSADPSPAAIYDALGRRLDGCRPNHTGLYMYRDKQGVVKKMVIGGQ